MSSSQVPTKKNRDSFPKQAEKLKVASNIDLERDQEHWAPTQVRQQQAHNPGFLFLRDHTSLANLCLTSGRPKDGTKNAGAVSSDWEQDQSVTYPHPQ